jgi:hypothetical protein
VTATLPDPVQLERPDVDWERHQGTGAPKILPPPGVTWRSSSGKSRQRHRYYTRVTTYADAISDQYNLMQWKMERVALGLGQRPDYVRLASALTDRDDDRDARRELVAKALEAAGPNKADEGTALHALTERIDRGEDLGNPPPELVPDLVAYEALSGELFRFVQRECRVVCDELECAGTPDGIAHLAEACPAGCGPEVLHVVDTKTGSIRYPAKMAIQLAIYAHSKRYDPATGERHELGDGRPMCLKWGAIVHLPVESGRAAPYWLDLERGWHGAALCGPVREWNAQRADDVLRPFAEVLPVVASADGTVGRGEVRPASHNPKDARPAPAEATDLTEALAASLEQRGEVVELAEVVRHPSGHVEVVGEPRALEVVPAPLSAVNSAERCPTTDLLVGECACRVHRPDLAAVGDDGVEVDELTTFDYTGEPGDPGDPLVDEILAVPTARDLELLWQRRRDDWTEAHVQRATERYGVLERERAAERPRAAMRAAIETAATVEALTALMIDRRDEPWMTDDLFTLADARYWTLRGEPQRVRIE